MPDIIHLLPDSVSNQIAAGEVILRPASAVKELLENSIDAGATEISLVIKDAGKTLIQISDNGCGMSESDARMSFERHATSKIHEANDLFSIRTLGFRGEALASIAAVAQVELRTRRHEDELGTSIKIEGSELKSQEPCTCQPGTTFFVKNLFFNVPARRNFLKSQASELHHIIDEFFKIALISNDVKFQFYHNGRIIHQLFPAGRKQRIMGLFGSTYNEKLVPVEHITESLKIRGFVGRPEFARKTRGEQYFFVNGRYIRHAYLSHSIENTFRELIPKDAFPSYFIYIEADPGTIDVNIHPTKTEVNFLDSKLIYAALRSAVKKSLGMHNLIASIDFDTEPSLDFSPPPKDHQIKNPFDRETTSYNPFNNRDDNRPRPSMPDEVNIEGWEKLYDLRDIKIPPRQEAEPPSASTIPGDESPQSSPEQVFQVNNQFIVTNIKSGIVIIHQQKAHLRVLYEQFLNRLKSMQQSSQQELFPQQVAFSISDADLLDEISGELNILGFRLNKLGKNTYVVNGTPAGIKEQDMQEFLEGILNNYKRNLVDLNLDKKINLARSMAANLAIKTGRKLQAAEMNHLIDELFACEVPGLTPDGEKIFTIFSLDNINELLS
jgi:DNA mismatch repair protein MutL